MSSHVMCMYLWYVWWVMSCVSICDVYDESCYMYVHVMRRHVMCMMSHVYLFAMCNVPCYMYVLVMSSHVMCMYLWYVWWVILCVSICNVYDESYYVYLFVMCITCHVISMYMWWVVMWCVWWVMCSTTHAMRCAWLVEFVIYAWLIEFVICMTHWVRGRLASTTHASLSRTQRVMQARSQWVRHVLRTE